MTQTVRFVTVATLWITMDHRIPSVLQAARSLGGRSDRREKAENRAQISRS